MRIRTDGGWCMFKILASLIALFLIAATVFELRQERMNLTSQSAHLFVKLNRRQHALWGQQTQIAAETNPIVISQRLKARQMTADISKKSAPSQNTSTPSELIAVPVKTVSSNKYPSVMQASERDWENR